jgi:pectate disaccharide-lyase
MNAAGAAGTGAANGGAGAGGSSAGAGGSVGGAGAAGAAGTTGGPKGPCDIWVAPNGSDTNPGTEAAPVLTPQHGYDLVCPGVGGSVNGDVCGGTLSTMCLKAGTYNLATRIEFKKTRMGTSSRIITMMADPAATTKPILNFAGQPRLACGANPADKNIYGIDMGADWYRVKGLEVENANDSGILVQGAHDFVENCAVHGSEDTGVLVNSSSGFTGSGTYASITNMDSYQNIDKRCNGANADGFRVKKGSGVGNVFDGCRAWDNADDGYDLFAWTDPVTIKNSWAFNQGATYSGSESNGNGFKMGGDNVSAKHVMSSLFAFDNNGDGGHKSDWGFTNNSNPASMTCTGCGAWNNEGGSFQTIKHTGDVNATSVTAAKAAAAKRNADGSLPDITKL